jgi:hypothetical protein
MEGDLATSDVTDSLQKAARLRAQIEQLDRDVSSRRPGLVVRLYRFSRRSLAGLVVAVLVVDGWFAYRAFDTEHRSEDGISAAGASPTYSGLQIFDDAGSFAGRVATANPFDTDIELFVTVDLYDGQQQVGEVSGNVTLRPESTSVVELVGYDDVVDYTESRVHLSGWPDSAD